MTDTNVTTPAINSAEPGNTPGSAEPAPINFNTALLPALPNLAVQQVEYCTPWAEKPAVKRERLKSKREYKDYCATNTTHDRFISGFTGHLRAQRVKRDNPPAQQFAIVADYDTKLDDEAIKAALERIDPRNAPNFISRSYSGGVRAVWLLEEPLPLTLDSELAKYLLQEEQAQLNLDGLFGPIDPAFQKPEQYYHQGWGWKACNPEPISKARSRLWLSNALGKVRQRKQGSVPIERIAEEVEKRYPGRWRGTFALGARGKRFWDSEADNDSAAIVTPEGMVCFTGARPFVSWTTIFGPNFMQEWEENSTGQALCDVYFCADKFYVYNERRATNGTDVREWLRMNRQSVESLLQSKYGLRKRTANKEEETSEVARAVGSIIELNSVNAVAPLIYQTDRVVAVNGVSVLNTSFVQVQQPDTTKGKTWGDGFPWIADFLEQLFPDADAREHFLGEWAYAYQNAYHHHPRNGHILFIAGEAGTGKNFLSEVLYGPSLGGFADASDYLLGNSKYNERLFAVGAWVCNDSVANTDHKARRIFASNLKKQAANQHHVCEEKFKSAVSLPWQGRVLITLNTDPYSLELLPQTDASNADKMAFFRTGDVRLTDPDAAKKARAELPALCAYLLSSSVPERLADARWGVVAYHDSTLLQEAQEGSTTGSVAEILTTFLRSAFDADKSADCVSGLASEWLQMMAPELRQMAREMGTVYSFGRALRALVLNGSYPISEKQQRRGRIYIVERQDFENYTKGELNAEE